MPRGETDEIIGQMGDATVHLVNVNLELVQRLARRGSTPGGPSDGPGAAQDVWMTWAESAGDLVQISYLAAQLVDALWNRRTSGADT